jgi:hypothetical protein
MKNPLVVVAVVTLMTPILSLAEKSSAPTPDARAQESTQKQIEEKRRGIMSEAVSALYETKNALYALDKNNKQDAMAAIERAAGKLDVLLAREPKLALAPTDVRAAIIDIAGDLDAVKEVHKRAERLLLDGQVQLARHLLRDFASEAVIGVTNIPLASYPDALKKSAKLIEDGKLDQAKSTLQGALNTLLVVETLIPLPVLNAQLLLKDAEALAAKKDRSGEENKQLTTQLDAAKVELQFAEALGYGTKGDFKNLYTQLSDIEGKTTNGKFASGIFNKIKSSLSNLSDSIRVANTKKGESKAARQ